MSENQNIMISPQQGAEDLSHAGHGSPPSHQSRQEKDEGYYWYEAVFLDRESIEASFRDIAEDYPKYDIIRGEYHITTAFKPEQRNESLYGTAVTVHIVGYAYGPVPDSKGKAVSENEGFLVKVSSPDRQMQQLLSSIHKKWHITGSYTVAGKYTEQLDFSDYVPVDITTSGVFGMGDSEGRITLK